MTLIMFVKVKVIEAESSFQRFTESTIERVATSHSYLRVFF